jgi:hypothetical protein
VLSGLGQFFCRNCRDAERNFTALLDAKKICPKCERKCKAPKYIGKIFHDFWRTAAHEMWKAGNSAQDCMEVIGQTTEPMFKRYADLFSDEEKQQRQREVQQRRTTWRESQPQTEPSAIPTVTERVQ